MIVIDPSIGMYMSFDGSSMVIDMDSGKFVVYDGRGMSIDPTTGRWVVFLKISLNSWCVFIITRESAHTLSSPAFDPWGEGSPFHVTLPSPPHKNWLSRSVRRSGVIGSSIMQHAPSPWTRSWRWEDGCAQNHLTRVYYYILIRLGLFYMPSNTK